MTRPSNLLLPPLSEQIAIAKILSEWDHAIDLVSHKIELKERLKKGLMQRLLTGKVRLKGFDEKLRLVCEWPVCLLSMNLFLR